MEKKTEKNKITMNEWNMMRIILKDTCIINL